MSEQGGVTRDQFIRGFTAIQAYHRMVREIDAAMKRGGVTMRMEDIGGEAILNELTTQLEERCNDPCDPHTGTTIQYALYDCGGPIRLHDGQTFMVKTAEEIWTYWEAAKEGPFLPDLTQGPSE